MQKRCYAGPASALMGLLALALAGPAAAQTTYITSSTTINSAINSEVYVGKDSNNQTINPATMQPYDPTVHLVSGGSVSQGFLVFGGSTVTVTNGTIGASLYAEDTSMVSFFSGSANQLATFDQGMAQVSGGTFTTSLDAHDTSTLTVSGGTVGDYLYGHDDSTVLVTGGTFGMPGGINFYDNTLGSFTFCGTGLTSSPGITNPIGGEMLYVLAGTLQNGQSITGDTIEVFQGATMFNFTTSAAVPEASTTISLGLLLTLGLGGVVIAVKRKKISAAS